LFQTDAIARIVVDCGDGDCSQSLVLCDQCVCKYLPLVDFIVGGDAYDFLH